MGVTSSTFSPNGRKQEVSEELWSEIVKLNYMQYQ
jgi:hypothetical protein